MSKGRRRGDGRVVVAAVQQMLRRNWIFLVILAIGVAVRVYEFGSFPPPLNQDEASTGYDAFAVLHYGIDRNGFHIPVWFVSWGSGQAALPGYLAILFYLLFGFGVASLRAVNLVAGILSIPVFYALVRRTGDELLALLAAFLLAIAPWHIMMSRWELEANLLPALFLCGVFFLSRARDKPQSFIWAIVFFALTLWTYGTAYLVTPLFLVIAAIAFVRHRPRSWKPVAEAGAVFFLLAMPIVLYVAINKFELSTIETPIMSIPRLPTVPRFETVSIFGGHLAGIGSNLDDFGRLLLSGSDGLVWNSITGYGYLYLFGLPLAVLGLGVTIHQKRIGSEPEFFFLAWLVASVTLALSESVNINRINVIFLPLIFFAAAGIRALAASKALLVAVIAYHCVSFALFTHAYFGSSYRREIDAAFFAHFGDAVNIAANATSGPVCITNRVNQPYIFVLFRRKIDPHVFVRTVHYEDPHAEFRPVQSFARYTFGLDRCNPATTDAYVADEDEVGALDRDKFSTQRFGRYIVALRR